MDARASIGLGVLVVVFASGCLGGVRRSGGDDAEAEPGPDGSGPAGAPGDSDPGDPGGNPGPTPDGGDPADPGQPFDPGDPDPGGPDPGVDPDASLHMEMVSGNGQMVVYQWPAGEPFVVRVLRGDRPAAGVRVGWSFSQGGGSMPTVETTTADDGTTQNTFVGASELRGESGAVQRLVASIPEDSVEFVITVTDPGRGPPILPLAQLLRPESWDVGAGSPGESLTGAIEVVVVYQTGPSAGQPIPNISLRVLPSDADDPVTAACAGDTVLTGDDGHAICDLVLGPQRGDGRLIVRVGGALQWEPVRFAVE